MNQNMVQLTILFEDPFWIGLFERIVDGKLSVCKVTFGAEPKDYEVNAFVNVFYHKLKFSPGVSTEMPKTIQNPKRLQREVKKQTQEHSISTKSQQALSLQREEMKTERKVISREQREAEKNRQFELRQQKRKEKHKGK